MNMDDAFKSFVAESHELLQDMEDKLVDLENAEDRTESINSIFRAAHTIKGTAGLFGLNIIVGFTHIVESVLDKVRSNILPLDEGLVSLMLECKDYLGRVIDAIEDGNIKEVPQDAEDERKLMERLFVYLDPDRIATPKQAIDTTQPREKAAEVIGNHHDTMDNDNWHISVKFGPDVLRNGMDPLSFLRYLSTLGDIVHIETHFDTMPAATEMDAESCYLGYQINFKSTADKPTLEGVFEFVREDCLLHIIPPHARADDFIAAIENMANEELKLGEMLVRCGTLTDHELEALLKLQTQTSDDSNTNRRLGEIVVEDKLARPEVVDAALNKQEQVRRSKEKQSKTIRVDADKLDHLINLIGELVISGAGIESEAKLFGGGRLLEAALTMARLIEDVRDSALNLRMVQIGETFQRFQRVVRDLSKELGKNIELKINGGDTELDKTVIEKIGDPLTHLVRNAMDHGIEMPDVRLQRGKPETGTLQLNAFHESGSIVIEVSDDGGGLSKQRILAKAIEKGLVAADAELTEAQIYQLIFEAGFSTAAQVSNLSGRGVGMDVVRRNIEALRGSIEIESEEGYGTTIKVRLPLTLAIIDGFMMRIGTAYFVLPLDIVEECRELSEIEQAQSKRNSFINLRGEVLPLIRLRDHFGQHDQPPKRENIIVVKHGSYKAGIVVDQLMGELQTVIKPLGPLFDRLEGISGSTILGSGEVALILDAPALIQHATALDAAGTIEHRSLAALK